MRVKKVLTDKVYVASKGSFILRRKRKQQRFKMGW